jgi:RNA polymerase sigma-70 factor (ECF subfamily)
VPEIAMFGRKKPTTREQIFQSEAMPHVDSLFGAALRYTRSKRDAEDLVQETLLKAYTHFDRYQPGTNCRAWLFKILTNTFINRFRAKQREPLMLGDTEDGSSIIEQFAALNEQPKLEGTSTDDSTIREMFGDEVSRALMRVPIDFRMAVMLCDVYEFSYKECADIMECPIGTIMSRLYRGRRLLRGMLAQYALESGAITSIDEDTVEQIAGDTGKTIQLSAWRRAHG